MKKENLELIQKGLIIVDMVNGFVQEGAIADPSIKGILNENIRLADEFIKANYPVVAFKDTHTDESVEFDSFLPHCIQGTNETALADGLLEREKDFKVFEKNSTSGIFAPGFMEYIKSMSNIAEWVITGCCTDICVMNLAIPLKNYFNEIDKRVKVIVPKNAVDTYGIPNVRSKEEWNEMAFRFMEQAGVEVVENYELRKGR